jgi:hypothetical protein
MATNDGFLAQRGNLVFEVPLNWKPWKPILLNLGDGILGKIPIFPKYYFNRESNSLDPIKEDLIIDHESSLIIDNKITHFVEGHMFKIKSVHDFTF